MASKQPTLLEQAKKLSGKSYKKTIIADEDIELCLAWAMGEISTSQISKVKGWPTVSNNCYLYLSKGLKEYIRQNPPTPKKK